MRNAAMGAASASAPAPTGTLSERGAHITEFPSVTGLLFCARGHRALPPLELAPQRVIGVEEGQVCHGVVGEEGRALARHVAELMNGSPGADVKVAGLPVAHHAERRHGRKMRVAVDHVTQSLVFRALERLQPGAREAALEQLEK